MATMDFSPHRQRRESLNPSDAMIMSNRHSLGQVYDPAIMAYRPQRMSLSSTKSHLSWDPNNFDPGARRLSTSSISSSSSYLSAASNPSAYSSTQTNMTSLGSRHSSYSNLQKLRSSNSTQAVFRRLPPEIYDCILRQLRESHLSLSSISCTTCYLRDLHSLALTSRSWDRAVRIQLYDRIHIVGNDSPAHMKKFKSKAGVRLKLLRRTLRERRVLANLVHELKVPSLLFDSTKQSQDAINLVASVVMACPNLERLIGFHPLYGHEFDRLIYALSTRRRLREHVWIIGQNDAITHRSHKQLPPGLMDEDQVDSFLHYHEAWDSLTTLFLHSHNQGILEHDVFLDVFDYLPSLQHLCVSNFDVDDFNDATLQALPELRSLRLQNLHGITDQGLSRFAGSPAACSIQRLSLIDLEIRSLLVISKLLAHMSDLVRFTFAQESSPEIPSGSLVIQPIVASPQLKYIHWDILFPGSANDNLANSIRTSGFPNLRTLRAPSDPQGVLQALCRPRPQILLPSDKYSTAHNRARAGDTETNVRTLFSARKLAEGRIEEARKTVQFKVVVDEGGIVSQIYDFNGFIGTIGSKINYSLKPDVAGSDSAVLDFRDLMDDSREVTVKDGCTGLWNASHPAGKKWWSHSERYRYRPLDLDSFW